MKKLISLFIVANLLLGSGIAQDINIGAGLSFGGPLPSEKIDSTSGNPLVGATIGASLSFPINDRFSINPGLHYSFHGLDYSQSFTRDTLITFEVNGITAEVPSYHTDYINGKIRLHYIDISLLMGYRIWKIQLMLGPYVSIILAGKDEGNVRVVIGSGEVFEDYYEDFDNSHALRNMEFGIMFGSYVPIYRNLGAEMKLSRSFVTLHNVNKMENNGQGIIKLYSTYLQLGLVYKIKRNKE